MSEKAAWKETYVSPGKWLKRRLIAAGVLLGILCVLWCVWDWIGHRRLQAQINAIVARHEPIYPDDFNRPPLADQDNAAKQLIRAANAMAPSLYSPAASNVTYNDYPPYPPAWHQLADAAVAGNATALALMRQSRPMFRADWGFRVTWPFNANYFSWNDQRNLADLVGDAAIHAHLHGDDAESMERILDALHQSSSVEQYGTPIGHLVALAMDSLKSMRIEAIAPDLVIQGASFPAGTAMHAASPQVVREVIRQLLDDRDLHNGQRLAWQTERALVISGLDREYREHFILFPMWQLDAARTLEMQSTALRATSAINSPASEAILAADPAIAVAKFLPSANGQNSSVPRLSQVFSNEWSRPGLAMELDWRTINERRIAAISLAIQLYRADHGQWPPTLDALTPDYLPAVPRNSLLPNDAPMGYVILRGVLPGAKDRPLLYFDLNSGSAAGVPPNFPVFSSQPMLERQWRDVSRWYVATPPSTTLPAH